MPSSGGRAGVLAWLADAVPLRPRRCTAVAVDGVDGAGKTTFADQWTAVLAARRGTPVARVRADEHLNPPALRYARGRHSPLGFWLDSYDHGSLLDAVDTACAAAGPGGVVVVDGIFLHRTELVGRWDWSLWLDVPFEVTYARMAVRDGCPADPAHPANRRYVDGQRLYLDQRPADRTDVVLDHRDPAAPVLVRGSAPPEVRTPPTTATTRRAPSRAAPPGHRP